MYKLFFPSSVFTCLFTQPSWQSASFLPAIFTPLCTMCRLTEGGSESSGVGWLAEVRLDAPFAAATDGRADAAPTKVARIRAPPAGKRERGGLSLWHT